MLDALLDRSIVFSFDRTGHRRHARRFAAHDLDVDLRGRVCLVTGASSGLGVEITRGLFTRGADVAMLCRDVPKGEAVRAALLRDGGTGSLAVHRVDVSDFASVRAFAAGFAGRVDVLVHNAGVLPLAASTTADGLELAVATNLVGPFLLTHLLWPRMLASTEPRLVHVSSGGMYSERLDVEALFAPPPAKGYDGVVAYARTKRAQVVLAELLHERFPAVRSSSMHPGWADTPGVLTSLPRFHALTRAILRTPAEGADTAVWLAASPAAAHPDGRFHFDRAPQDTHRLARTRETAAERAKLWDALCARIDVDPERFGG